MVNLKDNDFSSLFFKTPVEEDQEMNDLSFLGNRDCYDTKVETLPNPIQTFP